MRDYGSDSLPFPFPLFLALLLGLLRILLPFALLLWGEFWWQGCPRTVDLVSGLELGNQS